MQDRHSRAWCCSAGRRFRRIPAGILAVAVAALIAGCAEPRPLRDVFAENCRERGLEPDTPAYSECIRRQMALEQKRRTYQYIQRHIIDSRPGGP